MRWTRAGDPRTHRRAADAAGGRHRGPAAAGRHPDPDAGSGRRAEARPPQPSVAEKIAAAAAAARRRQAGRADQEVARPGAAPGSDRGRDRGRPPAGRGGPRLRREGMHTLAAPPPAVAPEASDAAVQPAAPDPEPVQPETVGRDRRACRDGSDRRRRGRRDEAGGACPCAGHSRRRPAARARHGAPRAAGGNGHSCRGRREHRRARAPQAELHCRRTRRRRLPPEEERPAVVAAARARRLAEAP